MDRLFLTFLLVYISLITVSPVTNSVSGVDPPAVGTAIAGIDGLPARDGLPRRRVGGGSR